MNILFFCQSIKSKVLELLQGHMTKIPMLEFTGNSNQPE